MSYLYPPENLQDFANKAWEKIKECSLSPTPENYELWFVYFCRAEPVLCKALDSLMNKEGHSITDDECAELFHHFLSGSQEEEQVHQAGSQIQKTIENVNQAVSSVQKNAQAYRKDLENAVNGLSDDKGDVETVLSGVLSNTDKMIDQNAQLEQMLSESAKAMQDMKRDLDIARQEAVTDSLTSLVNRKGFDQAIAEFINNANGEEKEYTFSLIMLDIDHFKNFNDTFGHQIGDQVLRLVAKTLKDGIKGRDVAARYGGEEFAILLPFTNKIGSEKVADILREQVSKRELINRSTGKPIAKITFSAGVSEYIKGEDCEEFIARADRALYQAKNKGRDCVVAA